MDGLNFHFMVLEFIKYQSSLLNLGILIEYVRAENSFFDSLIICRQNMYHQMFMVITADRWNNFRELTLSDSMCRKWVYRLIETTQPSTVQSIIQPVVVQSNLMNFMSISANLPPELEGFGNQILGMIIEIAHKLRHDRNAILLS